MKRIINLKIFPVFGSAALIIVWLAASWPPLWQNPRIPPNIEKVIAAAPGQYTTSAIKTLPSAAGGVTVTPTTTAWANGAWVQITASTVNAIVLVGVMVGGGPANEFEIDIGKGPSGSETVVGTLSGNADSAAGNPSVLYFPIPINNIGASTRVAARARISGTTATAFTIKLMYYDSPAGGSVATTVNASLVAPSAAAGISITPSGTAWANSSWAQVIASTGDAIAVGGITLNPGAAVEFEIDIGKGASGSEVVVTTVRGRDENTSYATPKTITLTPLLDNIPSGTRVAVRLRKAGTSTTAWTAKLIYYNKTSLGVDASALTAKAMSWAPSAAAGASVTISGTAWANSSWAQLIASAPANLALAAVEFVPAAAVDFEIEFGIGSAGNEVPIGLVRGRVISATLRGDIFAVNIAPLINSVPSGSRVAVRIRTSGTTTSNWTVSAGYYQTADTTNVLDAPYLALPASANSVSLTIPSSAWANSGYGELTAGLKDDIYITRIITYPGGNVQFETDISTGASGSETVVTTVAGRVGSGYGNAIINLPAPLKIPANTRIATRMRGSGGSVITGYVALEYIVDKQMQQSAYRWFDNTDSTDVGNPLASQDTAATLGVTGAAFRLRTLLHMSTNKLATLSAQSFKLQFVGKGTGTCAFPSGGTPSTYTDVTAATAIAYNDNPTPADGAVLTANANDPTDGSNVIVNQTYEEANNFTNSQAVIPSNQDGKWDFSLKDNGAPLSTTYCFRAVKSDGTPLDTYAVYPEVTSAGVTVSVTVSDGAVAYGILQNNTSKNTCSTELNDAQIVTNNGNITENFNIRGQNSANWTLASTTASDKYVHQFKNGTCATFSGGTPLTISDQAFATGIAANGTTTLNLQITTPNPSTVYTQQSADVTITAVQP